MTLFFKVNWGGGGGEERKKTFTEDKVRFKRRMLFQSRSQEQLRAEDILNRESCVDKKNFDPLFVNVIDTCRRFFRH